MAIQELHLTENPLGDRSVALFLRAASEGAFQRLTQLGLEGTRTSALEQKKGRDTQDFCWEKFGQT